MKRGLDTPTKQFQGHLKQKRIEIILGGGWGGLGERTTIGGTSWRESYLTATIRSILERALASRGSKKKWWGGGGGGVQKRERANYGDLS